LALVVAERTYPGERVSSPGTLEKREKTG